VIIDETQKLEAADLAAVNLLVQCYMQVLILYLLFINMQNALTRAFRAAGKSLAGVRLLERLFKGSAVRDEELASLRETLGCFDVEDLSLTLSNKLQSSLDIGDERMLADLAKQGKLLQLIGEPSCHSALLLIEPGQSFAAWLNFYEKPTFLDSVFFFKAFNQAVVDPEFALFSKKVIQSLVVEQALAG